MISMARIFGAPVTVPAGKHERSASSDRGPRERALDAAHEVHHVRVALDLHVLRDAHAAGRANATEVVPPEVDEHEVLGGLLLAARGAPPPCAHRPRRSVRAGASPRSGDIGRVAPGTCTSISGDAPTRVHSGVAM